MSASVARNRKPAPRWLRILIGGGIALAGAAFLIWMFGGMFSYFFMRGANGGANNDVVMVSGSTGNFSMGDPLPPPPSAKEPPKPPPTAATTSAAVTPPPPVPAPPQAVPAGARPMTVWRAPQSILPIAETPSEKKAAITATGDDEEVSSTGTARDSAYAKEMTTTRISDARPKRHRYPPRYTLKKGTKFHCTVAEPIDTQIPGPIDCDVDSPVYSMDGSTVLIPAHSTANGMIEHGLGAGQDRAVVVFTDVMTAGPDFYPIPLGYTSGASDLGQNGVPVDVDEHTWPRIKNTLMFAAISGGISILTAAAQTHGGNNQYNIGGPVGSAGQSLAQLALEHDYNIPPTGHRSQARTLLVYVNQYIDLSDWYDLTLKAGR